MFRLLLRWVVSLILNATAKRGSHNEGLSSFQKRNLYLCIMWNFSCTHFVAAIWRAISGICIVMPHHISKVTILTHFTISEVTTAICWPNDVLQFSYALIWNWTNATRWLLLFFWHCCLFEHSNKRGIYKSWWLFLMPHRGMMPLNFCSHRVLIPSYYSHLMRPSDCCFNETNLGGV